MNNTQTKTLVDTAVDPKTLLDKSAWLTQHSAIFADQDWPEGTQLSICAKAQVGGKKFMKPFFVDIEDAEAAWKIISKYAVTTDTYFCVSGLEPGITKGRGRPENVVGLSTLFLDVDGDWGQHSAEVLPTRDQCFTMVAHAPFEVTMIVNTGGGLHVYGVLAELIQPVPVPKGKEATLPDGQPILIGLKSWFTAQGEKYGVQVDSGLITNPVQLLRPAGSLNWKKSEPRPVTIASYNASAITTLADLDATLPELPDPDAPDAPAVPSMTTASVAPEDDERAGTRFAHAVPVDFLLQDLFGFKAYGVNKEGRTWAMRLNTKDTDWKNKPRATTYDSKDGGPQKVTIFSEVLKKIWPIPLSQTGHQTTNSWGLFGSVILNGDFTMAAKILAKYPDDDGDYHDLFEALKLVVVDDNLVCDPSALLDTLEPIAKIHDLKISPVPDASVARLTSMMAWTSLGVAERWAKHFGGTWKYRPGTGWLVYEGGLYRPTDRDDLKRTVITTIRAIHALEVDFVTGATAEEEEMMKKKVRDFARSLEENSRINGIADLCQSLQTVSIPDAGWDADPLLLNTPIGVIDFRNGGKVLPHDPKYLFTKITAGSGDINATHPQLDRLLDGLAETDPEIPAFLQRVCGMGTTGLTNDGFCHIHGEPRSGKSALFETLHRSLGASAATSYSMSLGAEVFTKQFHQNSESASPMLHSLRGIRWLFIDEFSGIHINANLLKSSTGGVTFTTRTLHEKPVSWVPSFTLGATGNKRVLFASDDLGLLARLAPVRIEARKRHTAIDSELRRVLTETQAGLDAVLAFAMKGTIAMLEGGKESLGMADLNEPQCVVDERVDYARSLDPMYIWWEECAEFLPEPIHTGEVPTVAELRKSYIEHCSEYDTRFTISQNHFIEMLTARGVTTSSRTKRSRSVVGGTVQVRGVFAENVRLTYDGFSLPAKGEPEKPSEPEWCAKCAPNPCDCYDF